MVKNSVAAVRWGALLGLLLLLRVGQAQAQVLPLDSAVRTGRLPNGLTYYIRRNAEPAHRAQLLLVNKVGSVLETEAQRGLAHFLEHMAFNGTRDFPKNELISYLQKAGVRFGADLNAHTGFDETVFELPLPTDQPAVLRQGINILANWAGRLTLDDREIDQERGIILEELRQREKNAEARLNRQTLPVVLNRSRYAGRLPIGDENLLKTFPSASLRQFYHDWYRPDLQAVVAVGDFDPAQVEGYIKTYFGDLKNPAGAPPLPALAVPVSPGTELAVVTDPELTTTQASLMLRRPALVPTTAEELRELLNRQAFSYLLNNRLSEPLRQPAPPYQAASVSFGNLVGNTDALGLSLTVAHPAELRAGLAAVLGEVARVQSQGFTATELARARAWLGARLAQQWQERDKTPSASFANEYTALFLRGAAAPGLAYEGAITQQYLQALDPAAFRRLAGSLLAPDNRVLLVQTPEKERAQLPDAATLTAWFAPPSPPLGPYVDADADAAAPTAPLVEVPAGGRIVREKTRAASGVTELLLSNGLRVVLKPTTFQNDEVYLGGYAFGGTSRASDADFTSAAIAPAIVLYSGVGSYAAARLSKLLAGRRVRIAPSIGELTQGVSGASSGQELETALQLVYLYCTLPRRDSLAWVTAVARLKASLAGQRNDPQRVFRDTVAAVLNAHNFRRLTPTPARLDAASLARALAVYKERFGNAAGFTFVLVGNLDLATVRPLLARYLGALPARSGPPATYRDLRLPPPPAPLTKVVRNGLEDKAFVQLIFQGPYAYSPRHNVELEALDDVLELRLLERLREQEGGVYTPSVQASHSKLPTGRYSLTVSFGCAPQNVEKLIAATQQEIAALAAHGAPAADLEKAVAEQRADYQRQATSNAYWLSYLLNQYQNQDDPAAYLAQPQLLAQLTPRRIGEAARRYLGPSQLLRFVLLPAAP